MSLQRCACLVVSIVVLAACQQEAPAPAEVSARAQTDAAPVVSAQDMPAQDASPDEVDNSAVPGFEWILPDNAARVPAFANIYLAGQKVDPVDDPSQGVLPASIDMTNAVAIQFPVIEGALSCAGTPPTDGPDGGLCGSQSTDTSAANGYSATKVSSRVMFLAGVFPVAPDPAKSVEMAEQSETDSEEVIVPLANQVFLIGDGKTAAGKLQTFIKPDGATTLFLGFADSSEDGGPPGAYHDNHGHLRYSYTLDPK